MLSFIAGLMVGGIVGIFMMCLMTVAKEADKYLETEENFTSSERKKS